jgi:hypothetical protein
MGSGAAPRLARHLIDETELPLQPVELPHAQRNEGCERRQKAQRQNGDGAKEELHDLQHDRAVTRVVGAPPRFMAKDISTASFPSEHNVCIAHDTSS